MKEYNFASAPASQSCRLVDFESAEVHGGFVTGTFILVVRGSSPCVNMEISLVPVTYVKCPDYWEIEVVGCLPGGMCLPATAPFTTSIQLTGVTGSRGVEVVGANKRERFDVAGGCK